MPNAAMMSALEPRDMPAAMEYTAPVPGVATTTRVVSKRAMLTEEFNSSPESRTTRYSPGTAGSNPAHAALRAQVSGLVRSDWSETANRFTSGTRNRPSCHSA
jgi:hypothetical protein